MVNFFVGSGNNVFFAELYLFDKKLKKNRIITLQEHQDMHDFHEDPTIKYWIVYKEEGDNNPADTPIYYDILKTTPKKIAFEFPIPTEPKHYHCRIKFQYGRTIDYLKDHFDVDFLDPLG